MKAHLINMHLLVPRSRSSAVVKVKYKGYISQKMAVSGAFMFHKHILFFCYVSDVGGLDAAKGATYVLKQRDIPYSFKLSATVEGSKGVKSVTASQPHIEVEQGENNKSVKVSIKIIDLSKCLYLFSSSTLYQTMKCLTAPN